MIGLEGCGAIAASLAAIASEFTKKGLQCSPVACDLPVSNESMMYAAFSSLLCPLAEC
jgi:hypothetical protein